MVVPDNALNPEIWNIPEGYYAIDREEDSDFSFPELSYIRGE